MKLEKANQAAELAVVECKCVYLLILEPLQETGVIVLCSFAMCEVHGHTLYMFLFSHCL